MNGHLTSVTTIDGFTGHEHLPRFGLVNMNARLYDPAVGRFLSPDPIVQAPDNTQSYNRYSYCLNKPLRYIDIDGMASWTTSDPVEIEKAYKILLGRGTTVDDVMRSFDISKWRYDDNGNSSYDWFVFSLSNSVGESSSDELKKKNLDGVTVMAFPVRYPLIPPMTFLRQGYDDSQGLNEHLKSHLTMASLQAATLNGSLLWIDKVLLDRGKYSEGHYFPDNRPVTIKPRFIPFNINISSTTLRTLSKVGKAAGVAGYVFALTDATTTGLEGHSEVAAAKIGFIALETAISLWIPGGAIVVVGFELLDSHFHWKDQFYQRYIDATYLY